MTGGREIWWIASDSPEEWGGLRIAYFFNAIGGEVLVVLSGEIDRRRVGVRVWTDIEAREGWFKVAQITTPTPAQIDAARPAPSRSRSPSAPPARRA